MRSYVKEMIFRSVYICNPSPAVRVANTLRENRSLYAHIAKIAISHPSIRRNMTRTKENMTRTKENVEPF